MFISQISWKKWPRISPRTAPGAPPGTVTVDPQAPPPVIRAYAFDDQNLVEESVDDIQAIHQLREQWPLVWVNVDGLGDAETLSAIGEIFDLHALALEDVANANQRPKLEDYPDHIFIVLRMPRTDGGQFSTEQLNLFLGEGYVLTFQERPGDSFDPVRKRLRDVPRHRFLNSDYLAYALLDAIIDAYFPVLEAFTERLDDLEDRIAIEPSSDIIGEIFETKHAMLGLRRAIWPVRDVLNSMMRDPIALISDTTRTYLRDCYDHAIRIIDLVETYRELSAGLMEFYQSSVGHRMNEIMKVLTIIATIFIPLTFIAGIYGMNFNSDQSPWNMPELNWYWGYPLALFAMAVVAVLMVMYFKRRRWLG
ncbi:MAG: magnesium/cobalt transporter CorA [Gemmatimonadales bacterium]|jgi:magnesium transporter